MISLIWDKRAYPIYWELYPKREPVILRNRLQPSAKFHLLKDYKTVVLGDREFCSVKLGNYKKQVYFCLRLKKNEFVQLKDDIWLQLERLSRNGVVSEWSKCNKAEGLLSLT